MQTKLGNESEEEYCFYYKQDRKIVPNKNKSINKRAKERLTEIYENYKKGLPEKFIKQWKYVKLYSPKNNVEEAHSLILNSNEGSYDLNNKLNHLTGKEWTKFSCSWFIFNALSKDLKEEREICGNSDDHPATYSPTMIEDFIRFFTKERMSVLDPFAGIGSTLVACKRTNRVGFGIELNKKYYNMIIKRVPEFKNNIINGDSRNIKDFFENVKFDFCISSPPYWDILNRSTGSFKDTREKYGLDVKYSETEEDLGNITDYNKFIEELSQIYFDIYDKLKKGSYVVIIIKNIKKGGKIYPLAWDLARNLTKKYSLKDEKIWIQDKVALAPYGYPNSWTSNILHHYCIILRREE
ncbi:site-specific DNA-methyltransferase [Candidatus Pacearchaeota archaeon CG10_big_fil_rev_8_21_14_0_10_32_14]|nr:MAG: site-specific DNA-methyltransferase [Candidatus Pacearchaeota archaeon CG10_big_fil_rev_8_21_14_0_10_32_14]